MIWHPKYTIMPAIVYQSRSFAMKVFGQLIAPSGGVQSKHVNHGQSGKSREN